MSLAEPTTAVGRGRRPWTLRRQLVALLIGLVVVICSVLSVVSTLSVRTQLLTQFDSELTQASNRTVARARFLPDGEALRPGSQPGAGTVGAPSGDPAAPTDLVPPDIPGQGAGTIDVVYSGDTLELAGYYDNNGEQQRLTEAQLAELVEVDNDGAVHQVTLTGLGTFRAISTTDASGNRVITAMSTAAIDDTLRSHLIVELVLIVLAVGLTAAVSTALVRRALRPLERVAGTALRVSELPLDRGEVATIRGVDARDTDERTEVGTVGAALNRMLGHVEVSLAARHQSETQVRQFVADASHELRTPLASIRGYAELVRRSPDDIPSDTLRAVDRIESESLRMGALVEDLLLLARLDAGRPLEREEVDLAALAIDALADAHAASREHVWELELPGSGLGEAESSNPPGDASAQAHDDFTAGADVIVHGDEARLRQVFVNLLSNARVHTPGGTRVVLGLRSEDDDVVIVVADNGPGIPTVLLPSLFQRFSRGDAGRNRTGGSTGLGLAIAQAVVHEHGGEITARNADDACGGAIFEVRLRRAPRHEA